ncbi:hypothetical protein DLAC_05226 [Tieghemostelium lacteum]|uniref:SWIM-type domain-containing protein n=1 Tax=Tieghemostelium lacteum TaxID=361077 RepID=A0A151ZIK3_TIELA|nr:hypothetical protein DLAC_05226 [Tieghemostelium lacteum]|eukprot:KYQ93828.1 hypothetical protein DLAC_05226 [Tieghemostelium lacteum]
MATLSLFHNKSLFNIYNEFKSHYEYIINQPAYLELCETFPPLGNYLLNSLDIQRKLLIYDRYLSLPQDKQNDQHIHIIKDINNPNLFQVREFMNNLNNILDNSKSNNTTKTNNLNHNNINNNNNNNNNNNITSTINHSSSNITPTKRKETDSKPLKLNLIKKIKSEDGSSSNVLTTSIGSSSGSIGSVSSISSTTPTQIQRAHTIAIPVSVTPIARANRDQLELMKNQLNEIKTKSPSKMFIKKATKVQIQKQEKAMSESYEILKRGEVEEDKEGTCSQNFLVKGLTGTYTVTVGEEFKCTCKDYYKREQYCKHMAYVMLKELNWPIDHYIAWQKVFTPIELYYLLKATDKTPLKLRESSRWEDILNDDNSSVNLLCTCKLMYSFIKSIRFNRCPLLYWIDQKQCNTTSLYHLFHQYFSNSIKRVSIPPKFQKITISNLQYLQELQNFNIWKVIYTIPTPVNLCINQYVQSLVLQDFQYIREGQIPNTITNLKVKNWRGSVGIQLGSIPTSVVKLVIVNVYTETIPSEYIPSSIRIFKIKNWCGSKEGCDTLCSGQIPNLVDTLKFNLTFNRSIQVGGIPESVKKLEFEQDYNQPILERILPQRLEYLKFGKMFNQPVQSIFCNTRSLKKLEFDFHFNQPISIGTLPESLEYIKFGYSFNQNIDIGVLPIQLKSLVFGHNFNSMLPNGVLPDTLESLRFGYAFNQKISSLPSSLKDLQFGHCFNQQVTKGVIPNSLRTLRFGYEFNSSLALPQNSSLKTLIMGYSFNPNALSFSKFNQPLAIPHSVTKLDLGNSFKQPQQPNSSPSLKSIQIQSNNKSLVFLNI